MSLGDWDGVGPVAAGVALLIFAWLPREPAPVGLPIGDWDSALEQSPAGQGVPWTDPVSGQRGMVVPLTVFRGRDGMWCRRYDVSVSAQGLGRAPAASAGVACRLAHGGWQEMPATASHHPPIGAPMPDPIRPGEELAAAPS